MPRVTSGVETNKYLFLFLSTVLTEFSGKAVSGSSYSTADIELPHARLITDSWLPSPLERFYSRL